jgi:hypothetical protein
VLVLRDAGENFLLRTQVPVLIDVANVDTGLVKAHPDHLAAVTVFGTLLAAHEDDGVLLLLGGAESINPAMEPVFLPTRVVVHVTVSVAIGIVGTSAEEVAPVGVPNAAFLEMLAKPFF